jgi:hypothetical protein
MAVVSIVDDAALLPGLLTGLGRPHDPRNFRSGLQIIVAGLPLTAPASPLPVPFDPLTLPFDAARGPAAVWLLAESKLYVPQTVIGKEALKAKTGVFPTLIAAGKVFASPAAYAAHARATLGRTIRAAALVAAANAPLGAVSRAQSALCDAKAPKIPSKSATRCLAVDQFMLQRIAQMLRGRGSPPPAALGMKLVPVNEDVG